MEAVKNAVNRAFEAVGCVIRGYVEGDDLMVRDLVVCDIGDGTVGVFELSDLVTPVFRMPAGETEAVAGAVVIHILRKIVSNALDV